DRTKLRSLLPAKLGRTVGEDPISFSWNRKGRRAFDSARAAGSRTRPMNRRDQELLDRLMRRFQPSPRRDRLIVVVLVVAFLAGMTVGSIFSFGSYSPVQPPSQDGKTALAFFLNGAQKATR